MLEWRAIFAENDYDFPDTQQDKYQGSGSLWQNDELNCKVRKYVRENASVKGRPNMTAISFCCWVKHAKYRWS